MPQLKMTIIPQLRIMQTARNTNLSSAVSKSMVSLLGKEGLRWVGKESRAKEMEKEGVMRGQGGRGGGGYLGLRLFNLGWHEGGGGVFLLLPSLASLL